MSTAIAISTMAASQAAAAKKVACQSYMQTFDAKTATVASMQQYADCVNTVYPSDMDPTSVLALKAAVVVMLIAMAIGAFMEEDERVLGVMAGLFFGFCGSLIVGAVWWVLS